MFFDVPQKYNRNEPVDLRQQCEDLLTLHPDAYVDFAIYSDDPESITFTDVEYSEDPYIYFPAEGAYDQETVEYTWFYSWWGGGYHGGGCHAETQLYMEEYRPGTEYNLVARISYTVDETGYGFYEVQKFTIYDPISVGLNLIIIGAMIYGAFRAWKALGINVINDIKQL